MRAALRRRLTYANVVSTLALTLALGGGAVYAAGKVGPQGIERGAVRSYHVKNRQIRRQDIAGGSINSSKVSNETLKGRDISPDTLDGKHIEEATLGMVPLALEARTAGDARLLGGIALRMVRPSLPDGAGPTGIVSQGGLLASLSCPGGVATLEVRGAQAGDAGTVYDVDSGTVQQFDSATPATVPTVAASDPGIVSLRRADGTLTRLDFEMLSLPDGLGTSDDCFLNGVLATGK